MAIAYKLNLFKSNIKTIIFEKESSIGQHQSGRNSGVLHCGLSYPPGSLKANLAVSGIRQMIAFCEKNSINHDICGKIVVANNQNQLDYIDKLALQGEFGAEFDIDAGMSGDIENDLTDDQVSRTSSGQQKLKMKFGDGSGEIRIRTMSADIRIE